MSGRWMLNRAGIVNVYQYGQETLHFAGGRLLLRGVNGSGKSTAMNMLLPFLLDGDTRRIDAAGEQSGVLRSWMLAGRDDPQPVGYLWVEFAHDADYLSCGCGIKANRSSDTVTTWWWVTSRRPGIDFALVEDQRPLSPEVLRAALGSESVFRHDQRGLYRAEVRARLFGCADIEQHIRLLHIVRSPRVGDRVDVELPGHLHDALPQLSEAALLDAAQPLDDLEEHRRNVAELSRTATTLEALSQVYRSYAQGELRRRAADAEESATKAERASSEAAAARAGAVGVAEQLKEASDLVEQLGHDEDRLRAELAGLKDAPAYKEGIQLEELRRHVRTLDQASAGAAAQLEIRGAAEVAAGETVVSDHTAAEDDRRLLEERVRDLSAEIVVAGLPIGPPDLPPIETVALDSARDPLLMVPADELSDAGARRRLEELRAAVSHRRGDVEELRTDLATVVSAEGRLQLASERLVSAEEDARAAEDRQVERRRELEAAVTEWRADLSHWIARLDDHRASIGSSRVPVAELGPDLAERRDEVVAVLEGAVQECISHHQGEAALLGARRASEQEALDARAVKLAELEAAELPDPPRLAWQRAGRGVVFAELVDWREDVGLADRRGLEAAMEAAGLLGAEVTAEGALEVGDGGLVVRPGARAAAPLSGHLKVTAVDGSEVEPASVQRLLDTISTAPADLDGGEDKTVVTTDGRFRTGALRGRLSKPEVEHIGITARRAALERRREDARQRYEEASAALAATDAQLAVARERQSAAADLRASLPPARAVAHALVDAQVAGEQLEERREVVTDRRQERDRADEVHAEAVDKAARTAANLGLPVEPERLRSVEAALDGVQRSMAGIADTLAALGRSVARWVAAGRRWQSAFAEAQMAIQALERARADHTSAAARLATIEDSIGVAYSEIVASIGLCEEELQKLGEELQRSRAEQLEVTRRHEAARARADALQHEAEEASRRCVAVLPRLRRVLDVPGLLAGATDDEAALRSPVDESVAGVQALAAAIGAHVDPPRSAVTADGVRQSLRQRRDALGAGWDAEDRQADETLPLAVEINGPQGRLPLADAMKVVDARHRELTSLLSSEQDGALRNLLQGLVAREVAEKMHVAADLVKRMNRRLDSVRTAHGIGVSLRWRRRDHLDGELVTMVELLSKPPDLRTTDEDQELRALLSARLEQARRDDPDAPYRDLIGQVLDYRSWHEISVLLHRPGRADERLTRRTALSEGEKKVVSYLPLFAAVAASCDSLAERAPDAPRFLLLDDAFAKVSEDNHPKLFGLLVELDLDFVVTSERLWGTHSTVPELAITEVIRDADLGVIVLEHSRWDGVARTAAS